jgi:TRAP transporter 4TM/12TM fusion protein
MKGAASSRLYGAARDMLCAALLVVIGGWVLDLPGRLLGAAYYTEQFLALVLGLSAALALLARAELTPWPVRTFSTVLAAAAFGLFSWVALRYPDLQLALVTAPPYAVFLGATLILAILEATRRTTGIFLPALVLLMIAFVFVGPFLPATFQTRPVGFSRLVVYLALDTNAIFGKILEIGAVVVAPFIVFGFLLNAFGGSHFFSALASRLVGRYKGGPAKVSVVGSAAFGMVSGSAVANVVAVGSVSIPMMARAGYSRHVAAAIEAVSSTGGQLMPPIMGAAAFLMAELLEISYQRVVIAAILPSFFFYFALFLAVDFEARRRAIGGEAGAQLAAAAITGWRFLIPVGVLLWLLFVENRTAEYAGVLSIGALVLTWLAWPLGGMLGRLKALGRALLDAIATVPDVIMIVAAAGLIIGVLNITGISFALTMQMLAISGGSLAMLLVLTALLSLLLGLGMPTVGVYILLATLAAPALAHLGVAPIAAHFYVQYFGMLSMITPPIAIASFAAASVAGTDPWKTSFASLKIGAAIYLIPFAFVLQPELLFEGTLGAAALASLRLTLAVALTTAAAVGYVSRPAPALVRLGAALLAIVNVLPFTGAGADAVLWLAFAAGIANLALFLRPATLRRKRAGEVPHGS